MILNHIFGKKQNIKQNEVELYLNAPRAARNQDILLWWKVCINDKLYNENVLIIYFNYLIYIVT